VLFDNPDTNRTIETIYEEYINRRAIIIITTPFNKSLPIEFSRSGISKFSFACTKKQIPTPITSDDEGSAAILTSGGYHLPLVIEEP
jgi:hypothetical protein